MLAAKISVRVKQVYIVLLSKWSFNHDNLHIIKLYLFTIKIKSKKRIE